MKLKKSERHLNLPKYHRVIQAQNMKALKYNYTKNVPFTKAFRYVNGEMTNTGFVKKLKDIYKYKD